MKYVVKHVSELSRADLLLSKSKITGSGKYLVLDYKNNAYGVYDNFDDASDHAETLNEVEEL